MKLFVIQSGGYENVPFMSRDLYHWVEVARKKEITFSEAKSAIAYLAAKEDIDKGFFNKYEIDESNKLRSLFWSDSQCQADYENFGNVLIFYMTYYTNVYKKLLVVLADE